MRPDPARQDDEGFTLVEVLVSLALISVIMTAVSTFLVTTTRTSHLQTVRDSASQVVAEGMEKARGVRGAALLNGRALCGSCASPVSTAVTTALGSNPQRWDADGSGMLTLPSPGVQPDGSTVAGPDDPEVVTLSGVTFRRYYYVARCWQAPAVGAVTAALPCTAPLAATLHAASYVRLAVAVTWTGQGCGGTCSLVGSALISASPTDPFLED